MTSSHIFFLSCFYYVVIRNGSSSAGAWSNSTIPKFPSILIFGDSTVDTGNNNFIPTIFRCNRPPYGRSFPGGAATGRCSDGKLPSDILSSMIGLKDTVPPFLDPNLSDEDIVTGVCFASAGSGYDELTTAVSSAISMSRQLPYFRAYIRRLESILGKKVAAGILEHALVIVSAGPNDFIFNFYDIPTRRIQFTIGEYQDFVLHKVEKFVKELYYLGCRRILVVGLPPMGCLPIQLLLNPLVLSGCIDEQNEDAQIYNDKLRHNVLPQLQSKLPNSKLVYGDAFNPLIDMIYNPQKYGFVETRIGCCGGLPFCTELSPLCENSSQYLFFDSIHPTEATYKMIAQNMTKRTLGKLG